MRPISSFTLVLVVLLLPAPALRAQDDALRRYVTPADVPVRVLEARAAFDGLDAGQKQYAYWMSRAAWRGSWIVFEQASAESPAIFELLLRIYSVHPLALKQAASRAGVTEDELSRFDDYAARFLSNCGDYLAFGDTKFVPAIAPEKVELIARAAAREKGDDRIGELFAQVRYKMFSLEADERGLGLEGKGTSNYYGEDLTEADIAKVEAVLREHHIESWNTRVFRQVVDDAPALVVQVASLREGEQWLQKDAETRVLLRFGDYSGALGEVIEALRNATAYAANDEQRAMLQDYVRHFESGDIALHKAAMRHWIKDVGPAVETNIGFIETYRDPIAVRAEWEGLVAVVDREQSRKFQALVDAAPKLLPRLPWGREFEKDAFQRPDFTSLAVVAFANSDIPSGINIPNYDDVRMADGFKNVSLGNVVSGMNAGTERIEYVQDDEQALFRKLQIPAFEVQVGLHELLGHGSGKLLQEEPAGNFNFDRAVKSPLTGEAVKTWYKPGETWGSVFGKIASSWEECRAESVGVYLCTDPEALKIFGHEGADADDVAYVNWLIMARAGVRALAFYNPDTKIWGQAHMQARYAILRVMFEAGNGLLDIAQDAEGRYLVKLDRSKIKTVGHDAIGAFLKQLNVLKATADVAAGKALYEHYTQVDEPMAKLREYGLKVEKPRHIWVQPVLDLDATGNVVMRTYPATDRGVIDSALDRYGYLIGE